LETVREFRGFRPVFLSAPKGFFMPTNKNILVVEDDPASQSILARLLKTRGYEVATAGTGHEAMAVTAKLKPHLALVDIVLPEVSGVDFLRWVRKNHPETQVIMLSALAELSTVADETRELGAYGYFSKPPDFSELLEKIDQAMA
jgi:DNA-binding response OmpR family regulator